MLALGFETVPLPVKAQTVPLTGVLAVLLLPLVVLLSGTPRLTPLFKVVIATTLPSTANCIVPVAVEGETVAVNVTDCPTFDGLTLDASVVVVLVLPDVFTVCVSAAEVLPL